ncbi:MAG TPA: polyprenyl synthetase family protein [Candidatus Fimimorpha excrementavium]|nr:polyprenyl synthetase family protein [Candidatus Fimimorpha excrementavium]
MKKVTWKEELAAKTLRIEELIKTYLPKEKGFQKTIVQASNYSVCAGGKRLRPMLMEETYRLFGGDGPEIFPFMAAIEMIHTSSLVHDDLPCMDNDEYRRGRKTTWVEFGYDMAVLAGDALLTFAFETAAGAFSDTRHPERVGRAIQILAGKTGMYGMIGGQTVDVEMTEKPMTEEQLDFVYRLKTGALLEASMMIGAVLAGADEESIKQTEYAASLVGMAFQIQDDILDLTSTTEILGKPVGSDEKNQKTTYVTLHGLEQSRSDVEKISRKAIEVLKGLPGENEFLLQLIQMLITREK